MMTSIVIIIIVIIIITVNSLVSDHSWCTTKWSLTRSGSYKRIDCITIDIVGYKLVVQGSFWVYLFFCGEEEDRI